jgi:hypothetical protein
MKANPLDDVIIACLVFLGLTLAVAAFAVWKLVGLILAALIVITCLAL